MYQKTKQGDAEAQLNLGFIYDNGQGVLQNHTKAVRWYEKAAKQGHAKAQYYLGNIYSNGQGTPQNYATAVEWYEKAAKQGFIKAHRLLGAMYANGNGAPQNHVKAYTFISIYNALSTTQDKKHAVNLMDMLSKLIYT